MPTRTRSIESRQMSAGCPGPTGSWASSVRGVHGIPTERELLFTALLILVGRSDFDLADLELRPRTWQRHSVQETKAALKRLREEADRWSAVFEVPTEAEAGAPEGGSSRLGGRR